MSPNAPPRQQGFAISDAPNTTRIGDQPLNLRRAVEQSRMGSDDAEQAKKIAMMLRAMKMQQDPEETQSLPYSGQDPLPTVSETPGYQGPDPLPTVETPPEGPRPAPGMYLDDGTFLPGVPNSQGGADVGTPGFLAQFQNNPAIMQLLQQLGYNIEPQAPPVGMNDPIPPVRYDNDPTPPVPYNPVPPVRNDPVPQQPDYPFDENPPSDDLMYRLGYGR
jgi:hypothetical protein